MFLFLHKKLSFFCLKEKTDYSVTSNESMTISEFENEKALVITNPVYENTPKSISNTTLKKKLIGKLNAKNMRSPSILNSESIQAYKYISTFCYLSNLILNISFFLIFKDIQDLDMSPKSKRIGSECRNKG